MSPIAMSLIAFASISGSTLLGILVHSRLPKHHLSADSQEVMKLGVGMVTTMAALVLGLLIASAKGTFDTMNGGLRQTGSKIILLDRTMAYYGPETMEARNILRHVVTNAIGQIWPAEKNAIRLEKVSVLGSVGSSFEDLEQKLRQLSPRNDDQRLLQSRALQISGEIAEARLLLIGQVGQSSIPMPFFVMLVCWLSIIFFCFGMFSSRDNRTVITILFICTLSAASALFLILELDQPYGGLIEISSGPLLNALAQLGR